MYKVATRDSEIELTIDEVDAEGLFTEALMCLGDVFSEASAARGNPVSHEVVVSAADLNGLLGAWVGELVRLAEEEAFVPERVLELRVAPTGLRASVAGENGLPRALITDVSSDSVKVVRLDDATWEATVILHRSGDG